MTERRFLYRVADDGQTVERLLLGEGYSKRLIIALKQTESGLMVDGARVRSTHVLKPEETLCVTMPIMQAGNAQDSGVPVIYKDDDIIVYNKPAGLVCHRSGSHFNDTLQNTAEGIFRAMHRLDRDTSGALVAAKHQLAAGLLWQKIDKRYIAVVQGKLRQPHGVITLPLEREAPFEPRQIVAENGKPAKTEYHVLGQNDKLSVVFCIPHTGRMHQIRAHFANIGHPLLGDAFYGGATNGISRQALHCAKVFFSHPITHKFCCFTALMPKDMADIIAENDLESDYSRIL